MVLAMKEMAAINAARDTEVKPSDAKGSSTDHKHTKALLKDTVWGEKKADYSTSVDEFYSLFEAYAQVLRRCRFAGSPDFSALDFRNGGLP